MAGTKESHRTARHVAVCDRLQIFPAPLCGRWIKGDRGKYMEKEQKETEETSLFGDRRSRGGFLWFGGVCLDLLVAPLPRRSQAHSC